MVRRMAESHRNPGPQAAQAIRQALEILNRASTDWRGNGAADAGPLHWPVAVNLARREFAQALESIQAEAQLGDLLTQAAERLRGWSDGSAPDDKLRARIETALGSRRVVQLRTPLTDWLCGHCGGSGFEEEEPCAFCGAAGHDAALDTADARAGIAWWNSLTPTRRREWLEVARSPRPADAWRAFQAQGA